MLKIPVVTTWVKNVYSLWVCSVDTCVDSYTAFHKASHSPALTRVQPQFYTHLATSFTPQMFTEIISNFNLLIARLYTVSTAPIIKTKI